MIGKITNYLVFFFFVIKTSLFSQISGISASKLATYNAGTVQQHNIEFEPSVIFLDAKRYYDGKGLINNLYTGRDSVVNISDLGFRITYGVCKNLEMGMFIPSHTNNLSVGAKYHFIHKGMMDMSVMGGYNKKLNATLPRNYRTYEESDLVAGGIAITLQLTDDFSMDIDNQCQVVTKTRVDQHKIDYFINTDVGYYIFPWLQPIVGINYSLSSFNSVDSINHEKINTEAFLLNTGFTLEPAEEFLLVLNFPFILFGKNINKTYGFGFALTITFE